MGGPDSRVAGLSCNGDKGLGRQRRADHRGFARRKMENSATDGCGFLFDLKLAHRLSVLLDIIFALPGVRLGLL